MSTLFISYSTKDRPTAEIVHDKLIQMGFEPPFRDDHPQSGIPAGSQWERELYRKLRLCKALMVLVSPNWLNSKWCFAELAYGKAMGKEFFPVLIDDSSDIPSEVADRQALRFSDPDIWERLRRGLVEADLAPEDDFPWPVDGFDECPYPGLPSYEAHHAGIYFGRDDEILQLRERLNQMTDKGEPRLLYVVGASGSGKSSLVKAGLLPRLTKKESNRWCVLPIFRWNELKVKGRDWPEQLATDLLSSWPSDARTKPDWRTLRERYLVATLTQEEREGQIEASKYNVATTSAANRFIEDSKDLLVARGQPNATPLLIIDQFEEILSLADDDVSPFLVFLGSVMSSPRSPWRCIATVRTDFLTAIQTRAELIAWKEHTDVYSLPLMKPDRFYDVIRRPAEKVDVRFESDALVDRIVKDTGTNDALPLLAFALRELYERFGTDRLFTSDEYSQQLGGLEGCLTNVANDLLSEPAKSDGVSNEDRERNLHLAFSNHLVRINDQDQFVRRTAFWNDLPEQIHPLLQRFIDRRLITSRLADDSDLNSERVIEVAHEALFRRWDKLSRWLDERRYLLRWRVDVERTRAASGENWSGLTRSQLAVANDLPRTLVDDLTNDEIVWINTAKRKATIRWALLVTTTLVFAVVAVLAWYKWYEAADLAVSERAAREFAEEAKLAAVKDRQQAELARKRAEAVKDFFVNDMLEEASPFKNPLGNSLSVLEAVNKAASKIDTAAMDFEPLIEASIRTTLGETLEQLGDYTSSEAQLRKALELLQLAAGPESSETLDTMNDLAVTLVRLDKTSEGIELMRKCLEGRTKLYGSKDYRTLTAMSDLAFALSRSGDLAKAEYYYREMLDARAQFQSETHPDVLTGKHNLAGVLSNGGREKLYEAEMLLRSALTGRREVLGEEHPNTISSMHVLATVLVARGEDNEAKELVTEALRRRRHVQGTDHPEYLEELNMLAVIHWRNEEFEEAEKRYREALSHYERTSRIDEKLRGIVRNNLGVLLIDRGKPAEAEEILRGTVAEFRSKKLRLHLPYGLLGLGMALLDRGAANESESLLREAYELFDNVLGPSAWPTSRSKHILGQSLIAQDKIKEGEALFVKGAQELLVATDAPYFRRREAVEAVIKYYERTDHASQAKLWKDELFRLETQYRDKR